MDKLTYAGNRQSLADLEDHPRFRFLQADICDAAAMRQAFAEYQPTAVMHLAAESHVDRSIDGPDEFLQTNLVGTYVLLASRASLLRPACRSLEAAVFRFLHVSTDEVYGSLGIGRSGLLGNDSLRSPLPVLGDQGGLRSSGPRLAHDLRPCRCLITNCSNNYGPYQFPEKLIPVVILKALRGEPIPVYGKGENVRDWLYVEDHARALVRVLEAGPTGRDLQHRRRQ